MLEALLPFVWMHEIFDFHLLKFTTAKHKISRRNLIAKCLALLGDTKWQIWIKTIDNVFEICEDALGGLGSQIADRMLVCYRADIGLEHHVELLCLAKRAF